MKISFNIISNSRKHLLMLQSSGMSILFIAVVILFTSCKKEPDDNTTNKPPLPPTSSAIYVLNQGSYNGNNASVTLYNMQDSTIVPDYFLTQNDRKLGDTGADMFIYGSKAYIVTNVSSQLEIVDAVTFKSIKQIGFFKNDIAREPSAITGYDGKIFVAAYDNTVTVLDTITLDTIKVIKTGLNPDALLAAYGKIWVSNSGGLNFLTGYDSTISVIDPVSLTETKKITVGTNPYTLQADAYGDIYVITRGNYIDIKMRLKVIDAETGTIKHTFDDFEAYNFTIRGDTAYVYHYDFNGSGTSSIMLINVKTEEVITKNFITDGTQIQTVYSIAADPSSNDVYIGDAKGFQGNGMIYCFDVNGKLKKSFQAGVNPFGIRFLMK